MLLYDNPFSPFARKVRLVLDWKKLPYETIDGLSLPNREALEKVNKRVEVPTLEHDGLLIVNSSDIVAYLERVFPERPVYPSAHRAWVKARAWERCADTVIDPILIDISYWNWADRPDTMPEGLLDAARKDLAQIFAALEGELAHGDFVCGTLSIADLALFPHISALRALQVSFGEEFPRLGAWYRRMRALDECAQDLQRTKNYLSNPAALTVERHKLFWRGDRIEWMLARGFHEWFMREIREDRVLWPGLGIPQS